MAGIAGEAGDGAMRAAEPIIIKFYAAARLYDAASARYVTVDELRRWRAQGISFEVREAESGADVTRVLLA